jgi:hypothetical protein
VYIVKMMAKPPSTHETLPEEAPTRTGGIAPAAAFNAAAPHRRDRSEGAE